MEGPTPVSALIHAATMVTAGVYLIARSFALFDLAPSSAGWVAWIGLLTALFAATIALTVTDLKRILAYSTISQLGYMFLAVGVGAYASGIFHLVTHAFFKALLFLAAGSVMHALAGELDIRKMGNLRRKMPITHWTFVIGAAALAGIPLFSGFFSKDEILWLTWQNSPLLWFIGLITSALTAIYAFRAVFLTFWGPERDRRLFEHAHESPNIMTVPLIVLAAGAVLAGYIGLPRLSAIDHWLEPVFHSAEAITDAPHGGGGLEWVLLAISAIVAVAGAAFAYQAYIVNRDIPKNVRTSLGWAARLVEHKYYVDELYNSLIVRPVWDLSRWFSGVLDQKGIDAAVNGMAVVTGWVGGHARRLQTGLLGLYALSILFGVAALLVWLAVR
jgi:NADH-quinone oxidoreductase subunit L